MDKLLLTPAEAARALGVGRTKVYELMASGALASVQIGRCRRVPREALTELVATLRGAA
jgi:excisionase family DNA binding protein